MSTARFVLFALIGGASVVAACSSSDSGSPSSGGSGGASGASAGHGGVAGIAGSSGSGGSGGHAGKAGGTSAGTGGAAGEAGASEGGAAGASTAPTGEGGEAGAAEELPPYATVIYPTDNPFDPDKAMLGKVLFWDEQLSSDNTMACGTCHRSEAGGSDPRAASPSARRHPGADGMFGTADDIHGAQGIKRCTADANGVVTYKADPVFGMGVQVTRRKPPTYFDAMLAPAIFWDGRANDFVDPDDSTYVLKGAALEAQVLGPPVNDGEMACESRTWANIVTKLKAASPLALAHEIPADMRAWVDAHSDSTGTYPALFNAVFHTKEVSAKRIAFAIATHERRLMSSETPWDHFMAGDKSALTPAQQNGWAQFQKVGCTSCHAPPLFSDKAFHNLGFTPIPTFDLGRQEVTSAAADKGRVKTATIRNVALREGGGLLHYGFGPGASLDTVMAAYNNPPGLENSDPLMIPLRIADSDMKDMIDFMRNGLLDPRVKNALPPFDRPKLNSEQ